MSPTATSAPVPDPSGAGNGPGADAGPDAGRAAIQDGVQPGQAPLHPYAVPPSGHGLTALPAHTLAQLVRDGEVSVVEVAQAHLDRVAEAEPWTRALVHVDREEVLDQARLLDVRRAEGRELGPLAGVPVVVKDNLDVKRQLTTSGSKAPTRHGAPAAVDADVVRRVRRAGALLLGRANMDELAMGASTQTSAFGRTHNPHDVRRSAGGSSGGSAAAVAAGEATLSLGTDTGGSVREPASQCGVVGMAPTPGVLPMCGVVPFAPGLDRVGPLARTVEDVGLLLAVGGRRPRLAEAARSSGEPRDLTGLRVGVVEELVGPRNQPGVLARHDLVVERLQELGARVTRVSAPAAGRALATYMSITSALAVDVLGPYVDSGLAGPEVVRRHAWGLEMLRELPSQLEVARAAQQVLHAQVTQALSGRHLLLSPTMPTTAPLLEGHMAPEALADPLAAPYTDCWTVVANLVGLPALSLPSGRSADDGMPVGTMLMGPPRSDHRILQVAAALEAAGVDA